ncbi:MAG: UDP-N-acetylmuramoyl-tripeptide--D-alanyl-D-alanine ligase [Paludibacteraceae bacterium]|nr:UDP-N-acetylmuramoyl-tripeptide--D-alanyl-D-alanine ligase [Paludibacteraceae bacterium]
MTKLDVQSVYELFVACDGVTTDSRNCPNNSLFIALKGASFNGNKFAADAVAKGCKYALVDEEEYADGKQLFLVDDCLKMLQKLANYHRRYLNLPILGITGTNGKTTTKELVSAVLSKKYNLLYTQGNLNNQIGVPLTLLRLTSSHEMAVVEMGASHPGDIKELVDIAEPNFGLITNVGHAHILGFGSFEGVVKTKGELYDFIRSKSGKIFLNCNNSILCSIAHGIDYIPYGTDFSCYVSAQSLGAAPFLKVRWGSREISTNLIGEYNFENVLAAICVGAYFDVPADDIVAALSTYVPSNNRSQFKKCGSNNLIIDAYNANPTSMMAALENFDKMTCTGKRVLVLGDMKELGVDSDMEHLNVIKWISARSYDQVFLVGDCFKKAADGKYTVFENVAKLCEHLRGAAVSNANVLIKGSNSTKLIECVDCFDV